MGQNSNKEDISSSNLKTCFLRQKQSLCLDAKKIYSQRRIREFYEAEEGQVYVSVSGKDSLVMLDLVREIYPHVRAVYVDTGLEYPEVRKFIREIPNVTIVKPKMRFPDVITRYGFPVVSKRVAQYVSEIQTVTGKNDATIVLRSTGYRKDGSFSAYAKISDKWLYLKDAPFKISHKCCKVMKKDPLNDFAKQSGLSPFIGLMADEGAGRELSYLQYGCNVFNQKHKQSRPIMIWRQDDVLEYILKNNIAIPSVYGEIVKTSKGFETTGCNRTGCVFCAFGAHLEKGMNRFQRLYLTHPKLHDYCMDNLGMKAVLEFVGVEIYPTTLF